MLKGVHICRFDSAEHLKGRARTYEAIKAAVVAAGRFSIFEATANKRNAELFTRLNHDPELVTDNTREYPWIYVTRKAEGR